MKFAVTQEVFKKALDVGALAAVSDTAQLDDETIALLVKSVNISADKELIVKSGHNLLATRYAMEADKKKGVSVTTAGSILVPAKELIKWVSAQGKNSNIIVEFKESKTPTTIDIQSEKSGDEVAKFTIRKIGTVKLVSEDSAGTVGKWELDCYDPDQGIQVNFDATSKGDHMFDIQAQKLATALTKVSSACLDNDYTHLKDSVSIQNYKGTIYFAATDTKRCALYKGETVDNIDSDKSILISMKMLTLIAKALDAESKTVINYNFDNNKVYLSQKNVDVRITCPDDDTIANFSDISKLIDKDYVSAGEVDRSAFLKVLTSAALVNKRSVLFSFDKDNKSMIVKAISENGTYKPTVSKTQIEGLEKDASAVWSAEHIIDLLKVVKTGQIAMMLPDNMKSVKFLSEDDPNFMYFLMAISNHKYTNV